MRALLPRAIATVVVLLAAGPTVLTAPDRAAWDISRYVFVPGIGTPLVAVVDSDTDRLAGLLHLGLVPRQVEVSRDLGILVATDGTAAAITVLAAFGGTPRRIALPHAVGRLVLGTTGRLVAAVDSNGGTITLVELAPVRVAATIAGLPPLRDVMFGDKDTQLFVAAETRSEVGVIDVATARLTGEIATILPGPGGVAALARTPDGRRVLARPDRGPISVLDVARGAPVGALDAGPAASGIVPSGTGALLFGLDDTTATLAVFRGDRTDPPVRLPGAPAQTGVYTAWLDSVAFVPSAAQHRLRIYDLDRLALDGEIALPGRPGRGAVTSDSRKLYLPVSDPPQLVAVDGATRRVVATIALPAPPLSAVIAGGWGLCH